MLFVEFCFQGSFGLPQKEFKSSYFESNKEDENDLHLHFVSVIRGPSTQLHKYYLNGLILI